jgi:hypothetical protein
MRAELLMERLSSYYKLLLLPILLTLVLLLIIIIIVTGALSLPELKYSFGIMNYSSENMKKSVGN